MSGLDKERRERLHRALASRARVASRARAAMGLDMVLDEAGAANVPTSAGILSGVVLAWHGVGRPAAFACYGEVNFDGATSEWIFDMARLGDDDGLAVFAALSREADKRLADAALHLREPVMQKIATYSPGDDLYFVDIGEEPLIHLNVIDGGFMDRQTQADIDAEIAHRELREWGARGRVNA